MKWLCQLRLFGFLSIPPLALSLTRTASSLDASRLRGSTFAWDYTTNGLSWKEGSCASTAEDQSPINISSTTAAVAPDDDTFFFSYLPYEAPVKMINDGRFLYATFPNDNNKMGGIALGLSYPDHLTVNYHIYKMVIHTPSEHTFAGKKVPLEIQLFHRKEYADLKDGEPAAADTAVVAVGFHESLDEASPFLRSLIDGGLPTLRGEAKLVNRAFPSVLKFTHLFKPVFGADGQKAGFWEYTGSLTQPPCTTGVRWFVRDEPHNAKKETLEYFKDTVKKSSGNVPGNARHLYAVGSRPVFPRMAKNAVHFSSLDSDTPDAYNDAYKRVKEHQNEFKKGLADDATVSEEKSDAAKCIEDVGELTSEIQTLKTSVTNICNEAEGHEQTADSLSGGPAQIEAATKSAASQQSCEDQKQALAAKEAQQETLNAECENQFSDAEKEAETETAEAETTTDA
jgi:carbonic anhydrase